MSRGNPGCFHPQNEPCPGNSKEYTLKPSNNRELFKPLQKLKHEENPLFLLLRRQPYTEDKPQSSKKYMKRSMFSQVIKEMQIEKIIR